jgi:hypothetical protein
MERIKSLNNTHRRLVSQHIKFLQARLYKITEHDNTVGKFLDYQDILDTIVKYSNDFEDYTKEERSTEEWMYMIPTLSLYASLGFLAGIKNDRMERFVDFKEEMRKFVDSTLNLVGDLSDVLQDLKVKEDIGKELDKIV